MTTLMLITTVILLQQLNFYRVGKVPGGPEPPTATARQNSLKEAPPVRRQSSDEVARRVKLKEAAAKSTTAKKPESIREWDRDKLRQSREHSREALRRGERRRSPPTRTRSGERSKKEEKHPRETSPERRNKREKKGLILD